MLVLGAILAPVLCHEKNIVPVYKGHKLQGVEAL